MHEQMPGPSGAGSVVLELGPDTGALILYTPRALDGLEIEVSPPGLVAGPRTHAQVRQRLLAASMQYAAVYPELSAGEYIVWRDAATPALKVEVAGGRVTTASWPDGEPDHVPNP